MITLQYLSGQNIIVYRHAVHPLIWYHVGDWPLSSAQPDSPSAAGGVPLVPHWPGVELLWAGLGSGAVPGTPSPAWPRAAAVPVMPSCGGASWCFQMVYGWLAPQLAPGGDLAKALHGQDHLLHLTISPCWLPVPRQGWPCLPAALWHTRAQRVHQASPLGNFLSFSASVLGPRAIPARHQCAWVAFTALQFSSDAYLCVPFSFHGSYAMCILGTGHLMPVNLAVLSLFAVVTFNMPVKDLKENKSAVIL